MLELIPIQMERDYPELKSWWEKRNFPAANPQFMPPTGVIVRKGELNICAGFLFKSDANAAIIGNLVSNPDVPKSLRSEALDMLIHVLSEIARAQGFGMVCCSTNLDRLMGRFEKHGFNKTDESVSHFGRIF